MENEYKEYNEKYICCFFTIWNLLSAIKYKLRRSSAIPYISLFCHQQTHSVIFIVFHVPCIILFNIYFYIARSMFPFFLTDHNQKQVLLIKWVIFFWSSKDIFLLFSTFWKWSYSQRCFDVVFNVAFKVGNFGIGIHNVVSTLIWQFLTSRRHIITTTT